MLSPVLRGRDFPKKTEGKEEGGRTKWEGYNIKERKRKNKWMLCINIHYKGNKILAKSQERAGKTEDGEELSY